MLLVGMASSAMVAYSAHDDVCRPLRWIAAWLRALSGLPPLSAVIPPLRAVTAKWEAKQPQVWMNWQLQPASWSKVRHTTKAAHEVLRAEGPPVATLHAALMLASMPDWAGRAGCTACRDAKLS